MPPTKPMEVEMATKTTAKTEGEGIKPVKEADDRYEMVRCLVRDVWGSKSQKYFDKEKGEWVRYPIGQWTELPKNEIRKLRRVIKNMPKRFNPEKGIEEFFEDGYEEFQRFTVEVEI